MERRRMMMAKAQEVEEMKEWQLIYDGNLGSATRRIELTKDMNGTPIADLGLTEWICEAKFVVEQAGSLNVDGIPTNVQINAKNTDVSTALKHSICRKLNPFGSFYMCTFENQNNAIKMSAPNVINLSSVGTSAIESIVFTSSTWQSNFTTDTYIKIYGR